jgi:hypothetical protein
VGFLFLGEKFSGPQGAEKLGERDELEAMGRKGLQQIADGNPLRGPEK